MNQIAIVRLQFVTIRTRNLTAARRFYVELLGLEVTSEKAGEYVQVTIGGVPVCVDAADDSSPSKRTRSGSK